jgi:hypothetical protein
MSHMFLVKLFAIALAIKKILTTPNKRAAKDNEQTAKNNPDEK